MLPLNAVRAIGLLALLGTTLVMGCAKAMVESRHETAAGRVPRPSQILVYDFAVTRQQVLENRGLLEDVGDVADSPATFEHEGEIMAEVRGVAAEGLVAGVRKLGLQAHRVPANTPLPRDALGITGQFLDVDEGSRAKRLIVGFGKGQSRVDIRVQLLGYAPGKPGATPGDAPTRLLEFLIHADSGSVPGVIATGPVAIVAAGAVTAGAVAGSVGVGTYKTYSSAVGKMTSRAAEQAVYVLSDYFGRRGWISADKVTQADRP